MVAPPLHCRCPRVRPEVGHRAGEREFRAEPAVGLERSAVARGPPPAARRWPARVDRAAPLARDPRAPVAPRGSVAAAPIVRGVTGTAFLLFFGPGGGSPVEAQLDRIRVAIGSGTLRRAGAAGFAPLIAVTADPAGARAFTAAGAETIAPRTEPLHFGGELTRLLTERRIERVCAVGAGAGALLPAAGLAAIRDDLERSPALVLSNNYYSADLVALTPTSALDAIALPATDNPLPRLLHLQAGLPSRQLPRSAATLLDVDTPPDATVLLRHPSCPPELRSVGAFEAELGPRVDALMTLVTTPERELLVARRVGAPVWSYLESQTASRV